MVVLELMMIFQKLNPSNVPPESKIIANGDEGDNYLLNYNHHQIIFKYVTQLFPILYFHPLFCPKQMWGISQ
jgi:hypothetical protein